MATEKGRVKKMFSFFLVGSGVEEKQDLGSRIHNTAGISFNLKFLIVLPPKHTPRLSHNNV
jgi:hypothetical protein